jgi:hypothetical protein
MMTAATAWNSCGAACLDASKGPTWHLDVNRTALKGARCSSTEAHDWHEAGFAEAVSRDG